MLGHGFRHKTIVHLYIRMHNYEWHFYCKIERGMNGVWITCALYFIEQKERVMTLETKKESKKVSGLLESTCHTKISLIKNDK